MEETYKEQPLNEHEVRKNKVKTLRHHGSEPWPAVKPITAIAQEIINEFSRDEQEKEYAVAGRVLAMRSHGKTIFLHIQDSSSKIQVYIRQDIVGAELFDYVKHFIDVGDIIWCSGYSFRTKTGEVTLRIHEIALLSKCLHPLPEKFHGLSDIEIIYRQRYLDLIINEESRLRFIKRSKMIATMRTFLDNHGYIEVETPMLHPIPGGAAAKPFITHHNALNSDFYLRIAPELYLKRLVVGGFERVYEINRNFRNEGISTRHNPEFTMLEFYTAHQDYIWAMNLVETMLRYVVMKTNGLLHVSFGEHTLDFEKPFSRISVYDAVLQFTHYSSQDIAADRIDDTLAKSKIVLTNKQASLGEKIYALFEKFVEPQLIQPIFITRFPIEVSPLAKRAADDPSVADRFELFIARMEIGNAFNELNDPFDQAERFKGQAQARAYGDEEAHYFDGEYITALEYALPPTVGVGIGMDRFAMILTNASSIKDVILFPTLKKKQE